MRSVVAGLILMLAVGRAVPVRAQGLYHIDQQFGGIEFTVRNLGLFSSHGAFDRFVGQLIIDPAHPENTRIDVDVDANSVTMPWDEGMTMLRSADFFDVGKYPRIRFTSTAVLELAPNHFRITGWLRIRGVRQVQVLDAELVDQHGHTGHGTDIADFVVSGELKRSEFGMVSDRGIISDTVRIRIHTRIVLDRAAAG